MRTQIQVRTTPSGQNELHTTIRRGSNAARSHGPSVRGIFAAFFAAVTVFALAIAGAGPASAALYAGGGAWGYNAPSNVTCRYLSAWGQLRTEVPPPVAYAYNRTAGSGNDWQLVRYRLFYVDARTGASLGSSGYSAFAWARDDVPAAFSGTTMASFDWRSNIRVDTRIEFYNSSTRAFEGWTAHSADRYYYYNGYSTAPVGPISWCARI